jgi:anti-sigma regulatory factor (Ser/Thr protein kinase)
VSLGTETASAPVELRLPARPESVGLARLALAGVARVARAGPADVADLKLAISEVCNSLVQALDEDDESMLALRYACVDGVLWFEAEHPAVVLDVPRLSSGTNGNGKNGSTASSPPLGLVLARAVTDSLRLETGGLGTRIVGSKRLAGGGA